MNATLKVSDIIEVSLYVTDLSAAEQFYTEILGLSLFAKLEGRHVFLRCGNRMVLLFNAEATSHSAGGQSDAPSHGMQGAGHVAFAGQDHEIDLWKECLGEHGVNIEKEISWGESRSIYFRDPSGNSLEIASPSLWGIREEIFFPAAGDVPI
jgi:catechol 2,3-dioxygenase-like lactoylglutathione lyase family enzyme